MPVNPNRVLEEGQLRQLNPRDYGAGKYFVLGPRIEKPVINTVGLTDHYWLAVFQGMVVEFMGLTIQFDSRLVTNERLHPYDS